MTDIDHEFEGFWRCSNPDKWRAIVEPMLHHLLRRDPPGPWWVELLAAARTPRPAGLQRLQVSIPVTEETFSSALQATVARFASAVLEACTTIREFGTPAVAIRAPQQSWDDDHLELSMTMLCRVKPA